MEIPRVLKRHMTTTLQPVRLHAKHAGSDEGEREGERERETKSYATAEEQGQCIYLLFQMDSIMVISIYIYII